MKKYFILILLFAGCSSTPTPDTGQSTPLAFEKETAKKDVAVVVSSASATAEATKTALDEAIRSQNDDQIYRQAALALLTNSQDVNALNALALYHYKKGRFTTAKYFLEKALQIKKSSELFNNLGVVHLALDETKEGILAFRQALNLNSEDGAAAANFGALLVTNRSFSQASAALETAFEQGYRDVRVLNNYAIALIGSGKASQAVPHYEKALKDQPHNKEVLLNYAILLIENLKKSREGLDVLNRLKFVGPTQDQKARIKDLENRAKLGLQ